MKIPTNTPLSKNTNTPPNWEQNPLIAVSDIKERTEALLQWELVQENSENLRLPSFIVQKEDGIFIFPELIENQGLIFIFLNYIFSEEYYFVEMNYTEVMEFLYNFEEKTLQLHDIQKTWKPTAIKIASSIKKMDPKRISLYRKPRIGKDKKSADYFFEPVYLEEVWEDGIAKEILAHINIDEFIATMWNYDIRYGLLIKEIWQAIKNGEQNLITIARERDFTIWEDAKLEPVISFELKHGAKEAQAGWRVDILKYEQSYIQVEQNAPIYQKVPRKDGAPWWTIFGDRIDPPKPADISLESVIGIGVRKETIKGRDYIVANYNGFPRLEEKENLDRQGNKIRRLHAIHVDEIKTFEQWIGMYTGKVDTENDIRSLETIVFDTEGKNVIAEKNVEANIHALENITVEGSITGTANSNPFQGKYKKHGAETKGLLVSDTGDISVHGFVNLSCLEARSGAVVINRSISNSVIVAKRVEINGDCFNCTIIADEVVMNGRTIACNIISGKSLEIAESTEKGTFENTFYIFSLDLQASIEKKQEDLKREQQWIEETEDKIDTFIISDKGFPAILKILPDKTKRIGVIKTLLDVMEDPKNLEKIKDVKMRENLIGLLNKMKPVLEKIFRIWAPLKKSYETVKGLSEEIEEEIQFMKWAQQALFIKIWRITWPTHIWRIRFHENRELLSFTLWELRNTLELLARKTNPPHCVVEDLDAPPHGPFDWKD